MLYIMFLGMILLKALDLVIPDHHHDHHHGSDNEHDNHLYHIGVVTSVSLLIHNFIEGLSIYNLAIVDASTGILMALGVALHNIPLGVSIFAAIDLGNYKMRSYLLMAMLCLSTVFGAFAIYLSGGVLGEYLSGSLLCLTMGMIIYIALFELLGEVRHHYKDKWSILGGISGIVILIITLII